MDGYANNTNRSIWNVKVGNMCSSRTASCINEKKPQICLTTEKQKSRRFFDNSFNSWPWSKQGVCCKDSYFVLGVALVWPGVLVWIVLIEDVLEDFHDLGTTVVQSDHGQFWES